MRRHWTLLALAAFTLLTPRGGVAQDVAPRASSITFGGRLHAQYAASSADAAANDFFLRRVRLLADIEINDLVSARVQPDFAGGKVALQDVYVRLAFSSDFRVTVGQFKRAFDIFEQSSSTDLSIVERDGRIEGIATCTGVGGICSYSRLTQKLKYAERDQGVRVDGASGRVSYQLTMTNGTGINVTDENDTKSYAGRISISVTDDVRISGQANLHDYVSPVTQEARALAWGADLEVGSWRDGAHLQASFVSGDNWRALNASFDEATFKAAQIVASYFHPTEGRLSGIEPLFRLSVGDPDVDTADDGGIVFTPGLMFYLEGKTKIGANLDVWSPQTGGTELSFKVQTYLYF
jgi:hypothetical protein